MLAPLLALLLAAPAADPDPVRFARDVAPILARNCLGCHNARRAEGGLNMATLAGLKHGGQAAGELILEPGDPDSSYLIELVRPGGAPRMPYKLPPLSEEAIRTLERWVAQGAGFDGLPEAETRLASLVDPLEGLPDVAVTVPASAPVTSAAFSADGTTLAAAVGRDVLLFDPASGTLRATLADHPGPVNAVRITPDGATLIAAGGRPGQFGAVTVWDLGTNARRHDLRGHADAILAADLSPDGTTLATAGYDAAVQLWDVASGAELRTLKEHTDAVYAVAFAPDGRTLASASADRTVKLWDAATGAKRLTLSDATAELYAVAFDPSGATVLAGGVDRSIRRWKAADGALLRSTFAHEAPVLRLAVSPDGATLYSSGEDRLVKSWDLATLRPRATLPAQDDWPYALAPSPDGRRLAVGRHDGALALYDATAGTRALALREPPAAEPKKADKPELVRSPSLNPPSPRGSARGSALRLTLTGTGVGRATAVLPSDPGLTVTIPPAGTPDPNRLEVVLEVAEDARVGVHRIGVQTPLGVPASQPFAVDADAEAASIEPDDDPVRAPVVRLPATITGAIDKPGDLDHIRVEAEAGQALVFDLTAREIGSALNGVLTLLDERGNVVAESARADGRPRLVHGVPRAMTLTLRVADADYGGSGNHLYRIAAGPVPVLDSVFPLAAAPGRPTTLAVAGRNLGTETVELRVPSDAPPGTLLDVAPALPEGHRPAQGLKVVVHDGPTGEEAEPNDEPAGATSVAVEGAISGRIGSEGDVDHFAFEAARGERLAIEVFGRRLGTPIDPAVAILDAEGRPVPRAVLRPVAETAVAFRDHPSTGRNIRLTQWNDFAVGDLVLVGRELMKLYELPRNPDDDAIFWGTGVSRMGGERVGFLGTTPEQHPQGQPIYRVEVHPPGATFPAGGLAPVTLDYRNDDGGPGYGADSLLIFDPPADGTYVVRVEDVRGLGGDGFGYALAVRPPRPDFRLTLSPEDPNIARGGATVVTAHLTRLDGFEGPVEVTVSNLPPGVTATSATIEPGQYAADLLLRADTSAPATSPPSWKVQARGRGGTDDDSPGAVLVHEVDPGGPRGGRITVTPAPDLTVTASPDRIAIRPGERVEITFRARRGPGLAGRVPIDVRNLPLGVRVLNIGLNGVLVTEDRDERTVWLSAEPWAEPTERLCYAVGRLEVLGPPKPGFGAPVVDRSRDEASAPILLEVGPRPPGPRPPADDDRP